VTVPEGATILETSAGMAVNGRTAILQTTPATDVQLWVRYSLPKQDAYAGGVSHPSPAAIMGAR
jgi:hypothetical protein